MANNIKGDHYRYRQVIEGKVREDLQKEIRNGGITRKRPNGRGNITISIPEIDQPQIVHGQADEGVGKGPGKVGDKVGKPKKGKGDGHQAGEGAADGVQVEVPREYVLKLLKDELQLPDMKPKASKTYEEERYVYNGLAKTGPMSLLHKARTMRQAMRREAASGNLQKTRLIPGFNRPVPVIVPVNDDFRFRQYNIKRVPSHNAAIIFLRDGSGSMGKEKCEIVSDMCWWLDFYIQSFYAKTERAYIWHDTEAREVSEEQFYGLQFGGGTKCSSATRLLGKMTKDRFKPEAWNLYAFYFGDGENEGGDNPTFVKHLRNQLGPNVINLFGMTQVHAYNYEHSMKRFVDEACEKNKVSMKHVRTTEIKQGQEGDRDAQVMRALKDLLGKDRAVPAGRTEVTLQEVT